MVKIHPVLLFNENEFTLMKSKSYLIFLLFFSIPMLVGWSWFQPNTYKAITAKVGSSSWFSQEISSIKSQATNLDNGVLKLALTAYAKARAQGLDDKRLLTIIDYSRPSTKRRLWVVDVLHRKVLFNTWVSHGRNSGALRATSFSNKSGSLKSSLGVFLTDDQPYMGGNGYSLRMKGLEPGINDHAYNRNIVFHGAWYAASNVANKYGTLGRSWGCPAVDVATAKPLIDTIKNDTLVVAYYPDVKWLQQSSWVS